MKTKYLLLFIVALCSMSILGQNSVTLLERPTSVIAGDSIDFNVSYTKNFATARVMVKFFDTNTNSQLNFHVISNVIVNSDTLSFKVLAPTTIGTNYEIHAQLLEDWAGKALDEGAVSVVSAPPPPTGNSVTILNRPTTVVADEFITFDVSYSKDFPTAKLLVKFHDTNTNSQLNFDVESSLTEDSDVVQLTVQAPSVIGSQYEIHAQLLEGWAGRASEIDGVTVTNVNPPSGNNTLTFVNPSVNPLTNGASVNLNVQYNVLEASRIVIRVHDNNNLANSNIIGEKEVVVQPGNNTIPINDIFIDAGWPGDNNVIEGLLFVGNSTTPFPLTTTPTIEVGKGDESRVTYRGQPQTFISQDTIYNYQNLLMERHMGGGYHSNFYIASGWDGPIDTKFSNLGSASWVEWDNNNNGGPHKEFDIKIQKYSWHDWFGHPDGVPSGYPKKYSEIEVPLIAEMDGKWNSSSEGKCQINLTAWLYNRELIYIEGQPDPEKVDIIVHTFDNSGDFSAKYIRGDSDSGHQFNKIGEYTAGNGTGPTYEILRTVPGYFGEKASYNLIAKGGRQSNPAAPFPTGTISSEVDMEELIDAVIAQEATYTGQGLNNVFNENWYVHGMEWTVVGQSGAQIENDYIIDSKGKWTFESFSIPDLAIAPISNRVEFITTAAEIGPINNGDIINSIIVKHNLTQPSRLLVEIWDKDDLNDPTKKKIGQQWIDIPQSDIGEDKILVVDSLIIDNGNPGLSNTMQVVLFDYNSWNALALPVKPQLILGKGDGTITYRGQPYDSFQNKRFAEPLGSGYYSNWFVNNNWIGDITAKFGPAEQPSWVEWDNNGHGGGIYDHAEFDIKIQKYSWHNGKDTIDRGYPTKIAALNNALPCTATGQWAPNSEGRTFLNMTAWVYDQTGVIDSTFRKMDIIVHTWDNSGNLAQKYAADPNDNLETLDTIHSGGVAYHVLKRNTGGFNEVATYNLVPYTNPRFGNWGSAFDTAPFDVEVDIRDVLNKLIVKEVNSSIPVLDDQWFLHGLEWTYIGSSSDTVGGDFVQDSKGKLTLLTYTIPNLNGGSSLKSNEIKTKLEEELVYPNPFSESFTYRYNAEPNESIILELFSMDGRKVKTVKNGNNDSNSITINTGHLSNGMYILRIHSGTTTHTKKLIKN